MSSIAATVFTVLEEELGLVDTATEPVQSTHTLDLLGADSIDKHCIAIQLEQRLGIPVPDEVVASWTTVQSVIDSCALISGLTGKAVTP